MEVKSSLPLHADLCCLRLNIPHACFQAVKSKLIMVILGACSIFFLFSFRQTMVELLCPQPYLLFLSLVLVALQQQALQNLHIGMCMVLLNKNISNMLITKANIYVMAQGLS